MSEPRRSDMDFMFQFMKKMSREQLSVADLHFSSHTTFRKYADKLCGQENSGWIEVKLPVVVEGFPHLKARRRCLQRLAETAPAAWPGINRLTGPTTARRSTLSRSCTATRSACCGSTSSSSPNSRSSAGGGLTRLSRAPGQTRTAPAARRSPSTLPLRSGGGSRRRRFSRSEAASSPCSCTQTTRRSTTSGLALRTRCTACP